jgi:myo-inositol-1(or 4)-monophosphatase
MEEYLKVALRATLKAGEFLLENFGKVTLKEAEEKKANDFVSFVDREAERIIKEYILEVFPDHDFLGEEEGGPKEGKEFIWVVDPLDGTKNFLHGIDAFAISCALLVNSEVEVGVVHLPAKGITYSAIRGKGAWKNGDVIRIDDKSRVEQTLFATAFPFRDKSKFHLDRKSTL